MRDPMTIKVPRKLSAFLLTDAFLVGAAFLVKNGNYSALATALVASMAAFVGTHLVSDLKVDKTITKDSD
jgi:hypothetical protein